MKKTRLLSFLFTLLVLLSGILASCRQATHPQTAFDVFISHALVVDGTGKAAYPAHVLISGDSIALVDPDTANRHSATRTIPAKGLYLTPGFIDTHAHGDPLDTASFTNFLSMGATTVLLGQDGTSPERENLGTWMEEVAASKPVVNIGLFAGHNTLRMLSGIAYDTVPSTQGMARMEQLLRDAMDAGCFGLSTGLEYNPGYHARSEELNRLAKVVGEKGGLMMSHMRNEDDAFVEQSIRELLAQGAYCPVHVSHIKVVYGKGEGRARQILQLLDSARAQGIQVTADLYPYTASYTGINILFPDWAKEPHDYKKVVQTRGNELALYLKNRINKRNGPAATLIGTGPYKGKTLEEVATALNKSFELALMKDIGPYGADGAYFIMDETLQETFLKDPYVMVCTDGSPTMRHPRSFGTFAKILERYVVARKTLSLEEAVRKMTGLPAQTLGIANRGLVQTGFKADLLLFAPEEVREHATYENPFQEATGFRYVLLNGAVVKEGDKPDSRANGRVLKKR